jgi:hypothetical protein
MAATTNERCPWCGNLISHDKFVKIQAAIREEERKKLSAAEREMRARLEKEVALQAKKLERDRALVEAEKTKLAKQLEAAKKEMEKARAKEMAEVRQILAKEQQAALLKRDAEFARERSAYEKRIVDLSKRMTKKGEVAEGGELDLYEELRGAFPEDQIVRSARWKSTGLILHEVRYKGKAAGRILIDPKRRGAWQHGFVTKLRQDQSEAGADYSILATTAFPSGRKELFIDSGVIVIAPARLVPLIDVLRRALIAVHTAKLSDAERADKLSNLFKFITSPQFKKKLAEAESLTDEALQLEVQEKKAHDNIWRKRGELLTRIRRVLRDVDTDVNAILEAGTDRVATIRSGGGSVVPIRPNTPTRR